MIYIHIRFKSKDQNRYVEVLALFFISHTTELLFAVLLLTE